MEFTEEMTGDDQLLVKSVSHLKIDVLKSDDTNNFGRGDVR